MCRRLSQDGKYFYIVNDRGIMWCLDAKTGAEVYGHITHQARNLQWFSSAGGWKDLRLMKMV